jgi:TPR repeat protein
LGRTILSFRVALNQEIESWKFFKKALDRDDKEKFEAMLNSSRLYASAGSAALRTSVFESMAMSIMFDHYFKLTNDVMGKVDEVQRMIMKMKDGDAIS